MSITRAEENKLNPKDRILDQNTAKGKEALKLSLILMTSKKPPHRFLSSSAEEVCHCFLLGYF